MQMKHVAIFCLLYRFCHMRQYLRVKHFYATFRRLNITLHEQNSITRPPNTVFQICVSIFFCKEKYHCFFPSSEQSCDL